MTNPPIDVFFCTASTDPIRVAMAATCAERWMAEPGIRMAGLSPVRLGVSLRDFQRSRRMAAHQLAESEIYVLADDDSLLPDYAVVEGMVNLMERYPNFGMLSTLPSNASIQEWTPENYQTASTWEVMEHVSVGQIRFCRKSVIIDPWPPMTASPGYDTQHGEAIRRAGYRVGYSRSFTHLHLGEGKSTIWAAPEPESSLLIH